MSDDDALSNLKIKVFTLADGHRHWVMLFDFVEHHPDRPAPYVSHEDTTQYALAKDSPHTSLQYSGYTAVQTGAIGE